MRSLRVSLLQFAPIWEDRASTRDKISRMIEEQPPADWLVLPEMALSGFSMDLKKTTWGPEDYSFFESIARHRDCWITVGGVEKNRNVAFVFSPSGELSARYAKRHLFSFAGEDSRYEPGDAEGSYLVRGIPVSQAICYDMRFPYQFWASAPGVDAYCVIAAWGGKRSEHWKTLLRARAIENQAFMIGVNRTGQEPGVSYSGDSAVIGPQGEAILECGEAEGVFTAEIDPAVVGEWRAAFPVLKDRKE